MRIPSSLPLLGQTIKVVIVPIADWPHGEDVVGEYDTLRHCITIRGDLDPESQEQTFCHELIHACLNAMSHDMYEDEKFVDQLASLIHQAFSKAKYKRAK
jgi:Zn-dependent peptidase ImmA (M78 family)